MRSSVRVFYFVFFLCCSLFFINAQSFAAALPDTVITPDPKVMIADGDNALEITPLHSLYNGVLIEPINRNTNKGLSTSFYLSDSSFWSFYTNSSLRLTINGDGNIVTHAPLMVNNAPPDNKSVLRVNGRASFDSSIYIPADTNSFISINSNVRSVYTDPEDSISPYTFIPVSWAKGQNIPVFRLRHPNNVTNNFTNTISTSRDFMILPYQYGTAIEYNGVVECWVGEWSIHRGNYYYDVEGKNNGWGGVLWVGDDEDRGGVRSTARNNLSSGGNIMYGELSVEKFTGEANGDFRLRLPSTNNAFQFIYGERGSENIVASLSSKGLIIPKIPTLDSVTMPAKAQLSFDTSDNHLKIYDGIEWINLSGNNLLTGSQTNSSTGVDFIYTIPHVLGTIPSYFNVTAASEDAADISYVTVDATSIFIHYKLPPAIGANNLSWNWLIKK